MLKHHPQSHFDLATVMGESCPLRMEPVWSRAAAQTQHPSPAREALTDELKPSSPYESLQSNYRVHRIMDRLHTSPRPILTNSDITNRLSIPLEKF